MALSSRRITVLKGDADPGCIGTRDTSITFLLLSVVCVCVCVYICVCVCVCVYFALHLPLSPFFPFFLHSHLSLFSHLNSPMSSLLFLFPLEPFWGIFIPP